MTSAAFVFCCTIVLAFVQGFASPAFVGAIASDAFDAVLPLIGILIVARFAASRLPRRAAAITRAHAAAQGLIVATAFGWWWVEPHAILTAHTGGSLAAMGFEAVVGALFGLATALVSERMVSPVVLRETALGAWVLFLVLGGRLYRSFDHIEAGTRLYAALAIASSVAALAVGAYLLLRRRERAAAAIPALAPAAACIALGIASLLGGPKAVATGDSIVLVVIDTLRADIADGAFASDPEAMPQLARIAKDGVRFTQAISSAPWTLPATVSLLSGWNPQRHGFGETKPDWQVTRGDPSALYLASALRDRGYLTAAFVNNPYLRPFFGFDRGFYTMRPYHGRALDGVALALDWLRDHSGSPSFTLLHLMDPHWPYDAPPGFGEAPRPCAPCESLVDAQIFPTSPDVHAELERRYAAEVRYTDAMLGRFYDTLSASGVLDHSWLVVVADHGEEFWEHGAFLHGHSLYDELLRIPLVVVPPRSDPSPRARRIGVQVRIEDVAATILDIAGIDAKKAPDGLSLMGLLRGVIEPYSRVQVSGFVKAPGDRRYALRASPWKAIFSPELAENRLYNLRKDPGETQSLLFDPQLPEPFRTAATRQFMALAATAHRIGLPPENGRTVSGSAASEPDTQRALRSLGYAH